MDCPETDGERSSNSSSQRCSLTAITRRTAARNAVIIVGLIYAAETLLGLRMHDIFGIIPVDSRDHIVHPALAIFALTAAATTGRGPR